MAVAMANAIKAMFIKEERLVLFNHGSTTQVVTQQGAPQNGLSYTIGGGMGNAPAPTLTTGNTAAGGSIPASTAVYVALAGVGTRAVPNGMPTVSNRIPYGNGHAGESLPSAAVSITTGTGANNYVVVTPPSYTGPVPLLGWKVYAGTSASTLYYAGFTPMGTAFQLNSIPTSSAQAPATTDDTAGTNAFNSIASYIWATGSNATITTVGGALTSDVLNNHLGNMFDASYADPDTGYISAADAPTVNKMSVGSGNPYYITLPEGGAQTDIIGNWRVNRWTNPVTGKVIALRVHAYMPQGSIYVLTEELPAWFVGNNVPSVNAMALSMDYLEVDYNPTANNPIWQSELRCFGAPVVFLPSQHGVITGITPPAGVAAGS